MRKILLRRDGKVISELDVYEFLVQGDKSKDVQLVAGDVVVFQPAGPRVALTGSIDTPAIYELKSAQEPIREVLRYAGGAPVLANPNRVQLERIDPAQPLATRFVETFRLDASGQQKTLRDGDVVTLLAISPQFANAVTFKGHVAQPLRYPFTPGMRVRDLIPDRDALITPDFYRRKNLLVQMIDDDDRVRRREDSDRAADGSTRGGSSIDFSQGVRGALLALDPVGTAPTKTTFSPSLASARMRCAAAIGIAVFTGCDGVLIEELRSARRRRGRRGRVARRAPSPPGRPASSGSRSPTCSPRAPGPCRPTACCRSSCRRC